MTEMLLDYGLFLAKTLTILAGIGLVLAMAVRARRGGFDDSAERLEVLDLNDRYRTLARALREPSLTRKAYRRSLKAERKLEKTKKKEADDRPRLFVIDFNGDIRASEVAALRNLVTAVLLDARDGDEVLVRLTNSGGLVSEHGLAASQLARLRAKGIPLTIAVDKVAASGGYLMACVADRIVAAPFAILGSIGVLAELPNFHRLLERHGVDFELHTAGEYKRTLTLFGENTEEGRAKFQEELEETHALFKSFVSENRPQLDIARVATGEVWYGSQALQEKLVDELQTSDEFIQQSLSERDVFELKYVHKKNWQEKLGLAAEGAIERALLKILQRDGGPHY